MIVLKKEKKKPDRSGLYKLKRKRKIKKKIVLDAARQGNHGDITRDLFRLLSVESLLAYFRVFLV